VIVTLAEEIEEALDQTWQIYTAARPSDIRSTKDLIKAFGAEETACLFRLPDSWLETTKKGLT
jgi:hypothetical protein